MDGPVVTTIRALLTPPPSREMRVKNDYIKHSAISGAIGVKIVAPDVGRVIAGECLLCGYCVVDVVLFGVCVICIVGSSH